MWVAQEREERKTSGSLDYTITHTLAIVSSRTGIETHICSNEPSIKRCRRIMASALQWESWKSIHNGTCGVHHMRFSCHHNEFKSVFTKEKIDTVGVFIWTNFLLSVFPLSFRKVTDFEHVVEDEQKGSSACLFVSFFFPPDPIRKAQSVTRSMLKNTLIACNTERMLIRRRFIAMMNLNDNNSFSCR